MTPLLKSDIFFFISSVATVILTCLLIVVFVYLIRFLRTINRVGDMIEDAAGNLSEDACEVVDRVKESTLFSMFFPKKRSKARTKN